VHRFLVCLSSIVELRGEKSQNKQAQSLFPPASCRQNVVKKSANDSFVDKDAPYPESLVQKWEYVYAKRRQMMVRFPRLDKMGEVRWKGTSFIVLLLMLPRMNHPADQNPKEMHNASQTDQEAFLKKRAAKPQRAL
jgi:hypothetical protein